VGGGVRALVQALRTASDHLVGPGNYVARLTAGIPAGFAPFPIELRGFAVHYHLTDPLSPGITVQNTLDGALVGPQLQILGRQSRGVEIEEGTLVIPAVTTGTIDTTARWGVEVGGNRDDNTGAATITWYYEAVDLANRTKQIMAMGSDCFVDEFSDSTVIVADPAKMFAPFVAPRNVQDIGGPPGTTNSPWFVAPYEDTQALRDRLVLDENTGDRRPIGAFPWLTEGEFGDFALVTKNVPTVNATFNFRKNRETVFTIEVVAGAEFSPGVPQRIWYPADPAQVVTILPGDRACWQCEESGEILDAQLLWTFTRATTSTMSGFDELGFDEGGFGTV
jgi:hypothetical protein